MMQRVKGNLRRGTALIYAMVGFAALIGMVALGVDWGRVQLTKTELHAAAVASARYAAAALQNNLFGTSAAASNAAAVAGQNFANGQQIVINQSQDVQTGYWDTTLHTFTPTTDLSVANSVHVTLRCAASRGTGLSLPFLGVLTRNSVQDVSADSIAMVTYVGNLGGAGNGQYQYMVPATDNPWLSAEPAGAVASVNNPHNNPDFAGSPLTDIGQTKSFVSGSGFATGGSTNAGSANSNYAAWGDFAAKKASPIQAGGINITPGSPITFDGVNGGATNAAGQTTVGADGDPTFTNCTNSAGAENGIANIVCPINSIIGIYVDNTQPDKSTAPATLDFSSSASRDFLTLSPQLRQPFFIGDGRTSTGEVQQFIPPIGATRLYLATMDAYEWSNNVGGFYVTAHAKGKIVTVR